MSHPKAIPLTMFQCSCSPHGVVLCVIEHSALFSMPKIITCKDSYYKIPCYKHINLTISIRQIKNWYLVNLPTAYCLPAKHILQYTVYCKSCCYLSQQWVQPCTIFSMQFSALRREGPASKICQNSTVSVTKSNFSYRNLTLPAMIRKEVMGKAFTMSSLS